MHTELCVKSKLSVFDLFSFYNDHFVDSHHKTRLTTGRICRAEILPSSDTIRFANLHWIFVQIPSPRNLLISIIQQKLAGKANDEC